MDCNGNKIWSKCFWVVNDPGQSQIILTKINTDGQISNINRYNTNDTTNQIINPSIAKDNNGFTYLAFHTNGSVPPGINSGLYDIVVLKLDSIGNIVWTKQDSSINTTLNDITPKIQVDMNGNVYLNYVTQGTVLGGSNSGLYDIVVAKLDTLGNTLWTVQNPIFNTSQNDINNTMDIDGIGNIYVSYETIGAIPGKINSGEIDIVVFKVNNNGTIMWTRQEPLFNTSSNDTNPSITVDAFGNSYIAYSTTGTITNIYNAVNSSGYDIALLKLNTNGNIIWRAQHPAFNTIDNDLNPSIFVDSKENLYLTYEHAANGAPTSIVIVKFITTSCFDCCNMCCGDSCNICFPKKCIMELECSDNDTECKLIKKCYDFKFRMTFEKINGALNYYNRQLENIKKSLKTISMIINSLNNLDSDKNNNICILKEAKNLVNLYNTEYNKICYNKKLCGPANFNIYGSIENITGKPLTYTNGLGGITNSPLNGNLSINYCKKQFCFPFTCGCSISEIARKINSKLCGKIVVIDGLEVGIKINCTNNCCECSCTCSCINTINNCCDPTHLILKICEKNNYKTFDFTVNGSSDDSYKNLLEQISCTLGNYIEYIFYDCENKIIRIIFNKAYTLTFSQRDELPINQFIISTYVNCMPVNYGTTSTQIERYINGYILFYSTENDFTINYPDGSLPDTIVQPILLSESMPYYCANITFDLSQLIKCKFNIAENISLQTGCSCNKIDIKCFVSYGCFLRKMINCINPCSNICNVWRVNNILNMLDHYRSMLQNTYNVLALTNKNFVGTIDMYFK